MMMHALLRSRHARPQAEAATRFASSRWLSLASSLAQHPAPPAGSTPSPSSPIATVLESSHGRTLVRVTQGGTVVWASMKERADGRAVSRGILAVDYKERSFARATLGKGSNAREGPGLGAGRHDRRVETVMTDAERWVASRIQRLLEAAIVGVSPKRRLSVKFTVVSAGGEDPELVAVNAASAVLGASGVAWYGPFRAVRVALSSAGPAIAQKDEVADSMVVVCDWQGHVMYMRGAASTPQTLDEVVAGVRVAQEYIQTQIEEGGLEAAEEVGGKTLSLPGADPAAGRRIIDQVARMLESYLASLGSAWAASLDDVTHHIESVVKPGVMEDLQRQGRWRHEASRIKGSGCVTMQDLDYTIASTLQNLLRGAIRARDVEGEGTGGDGRDDTSGIVEVGHIPASHSSSMYTAGGTVVISAATCARHVGEGVEPVAIPPSGEPTIVAGITDDARVSSVFLTCSHGTSTGSNSGPVIGSNDYDDLERAAFVRVAVSGMLPLQEVLPFAIRTNTEVLISNAVAGIGSLSAAVNGMSAALNLSLLANHTGSNRYKKRAKGTLWTAAAIGLSYRYPPGSLDGEERHLPLNKHGWCVPPSIDGYDVLRDVSGMASLVTDAELTIAGSAHGKGRTMSAWALNCHAPTRITHTMIRHGISEAMDAQESRRKELAQAIRRPSGAPRREQHAVFGELAVSTASMPKLLADKASILRRIEDNTGCLVHVKEPGMLCLFAPSSDAYAMLEDQICAAVGAFLVPNRVYKATVKAVKDFGAFVSLPRCDVEAMLHISEVSQERIASIDDELAVGDVIDVVFLGEDSQGGLRVSKRRATRFVKTNV